MDKIHDIDSKSWIGKRIINLKKLLEYRDNQLNDDGLSLSEKDLESSEGDFSDLKVKLLEFSQSNESQVKPYFLFNSTDERALVENPECDLKLYKLQLDHAKRMISDRGYKVNYLHQLKTTRRELLMRHLALTNRSLNNNETTTIPRQLAIQNSSCLSITAIVVVQIWPQPTKNTKIKLEKEILFKSYDSLTDLRDQFKCQRDYGVPIDLSEDPGQGDRIFRGELFKSGFFLIGNTFYNDMRDPNNIDLSADIIDWSTKEVVIRGDEGENLKVSRGMGPFNSVRMEEHRFEDLNFRLGCPYLYMHQGECEHLFTISDIRYISTDDQMNSMKFPFVTATSIGKKQDNLRCYMCKSRPPHWYTRNNSRLPVDPYFFCENCFHSFNYDKDKKKVGNFQAYLYTSSFGIPDSVVMVANAGDRSNA